ncbi:hypothetical protein [Aurantimicrobium minutum]|uniref:hypothetical protein n=1 Tax=Aurantimicrobium minutum TaxID=708131 RepID=UPI0024757969|nr:hypothetical protein [Aurantimicrobium minutum]
MWITPADSQVRHLPSLTMDFETLFQDLENQLEYELDAEMINRLEDEERERRAKLSIRDRLLALKRSESNLELRGTIRGQRSLVFIIKNVGKDWVAIEVLEPQEIQGSVICPIHAFVTLEIPQMSVKESLGTAIGEVSDHDLQAFSGKSSLAEKVNLAFVLRDISRRRKNVRLHTQTDMVHGTIDHVGSDHLDVTSGDVRRVIPLREVLFVQMV